MKSIAFILACQSYGGVEKNVFFLANSFAQIGANVQIINIHSAKENENSITIERETNNRVSIIDLKPRGKKGLRRFKQISEICKILKENKTEIVIGFTGMPNLMSCIVGKLMHIPSVMSERGNPNVKYGNKSIIESVIRYIINRCDGGVFQLAEARKYYGNRLQKRSVVIPNPIFISEANQSLKSTGNNNSIVSVGRLDNFQKRYDVMLQAFQIFHDKHTEYSLKIYGIGEDENQIKHMIEEMNLNSCVFMCGYTNDPLNRIVESDIFLITSDFEGISNSLLEAMAVGMPCISTDSPPGGARMLIEDGKNGLLVKCGDVQGIADALDKYVSEPDLAVRCGLNAKHVLEEYSKDKIFGLWNSYISEIVNKKAQTYD